MATLCPTLVLLCVLSVCHATYLDLSYNFDEKTIYWPSGQRNFQLETTYKGRTNEGFWLQRDQFCSGIHAGTHMDSPNHFWEGGADIVNFPMEKMISPAVVVDIRQAASRDPDTNLTVADLHAWETQYGKIPKGAIVLQCSGWTDRYPDVAAVYGNDKNDSMNFHFPSFHVDAVRWLIEERQIADIGVDTPSLDYGASKGHFPVHVLISSHGMFGLENVKDTCLVPPVGATLYAFPLKIVGSSGAAARVIAAWDTSSSGADGLTHVTTLTFVIMTTLVKVVQCFLL